MSSEKKIISVMTPCYNEEEGILECYEQVKQVFDLYLPEYEREHLFIDNCSTDHTVKILKKIAEKDKQVKIIVNARNFGLSKSPYHGMLEVSGDCCIPVVADLQTPPALIVDFVRKWEQGYPIVIGVRRNMQEGFLITLPRKLFYKIMSRMSKIEQIDQFIGFGLFDRRVIDILRELNEPDPYFRGLVSEVGFEKAFVTYDQPMRKHGKSRHNFFDLLELSMLALTTYSKVPIRLMTISGLFLATASLIVGFIYFILKLIFWTEFSLGLAPLMIGSFLFGAVNLMALGLIGEYIGLILQYSRRFPLVVEKERINFDITPASTAHVAQESQQPGNVLL